MMLNLNESFASARILNQVSKLNYWRIWDNYMNKEIN